MYAYDTHNGVCIFRWEVIAVAGEDRCMPLLDAHVYMARSALKEVIQSLDQHYKEGM